MLNILAKDLANALCGKPYPDSATSEEMINSCKTLAQKILWQCEHDYSLNRIEAYMGWWNGTQEILGWLLEYHLLAGMMDYIQIANDLDTNLRLPRDYQEPIGQKLRVAITKECDYTCQYCGKTGNKLNGPDGHRWHIDHIIPKVRGGANNRENLTLACATCNMRKGSKLEWAPPTA